VWALTFAATKWPARLKPKERLHMLISRILLAVGFTFAACVPAPTAADPACKPKMMFKEARFSDAKDQLRTWTATIAVDARHCAESSGMFEIRFVRLKEFGPDLLFTERFKWSADMVEVSLDFWWDEAVGDYWISDIPSCRCIG
jgi:hypothetical protein